MRKKATNDPQIRHPLREKRKTVKVRSFPDAKGGYCFICSGYYRCIHNDAALKKKRQKELDEFGKLYRAELKRLEALHQGKELKSRELEALKDQAGRFAWVTQQKRKARKQKP